MIEGPNFSLCSDNLMESAIVESDAGRCPQAACTLALPLLSSCGQVYRLHLRYSSASVNPYMCMASLSPHPG